MEKSIIYRLFLLQSISLLAQYDICVYGGISGGVIAAYTAASMGKKVLLIETGRHLGGLSSGGMGYSDIGNKYAILGLAKDFYRKTGNHYGKFEQWIFEPQVAENIFKSYASHRLITTLYLYQVVRVVKNNGSIQYAVFVPADRRKGLSTKKVTVKNIYLLQLRRRPDVHGWQNKK